MSVAFAKCKNTSWDAAWTILEFFITLPVVSAKWRPQVRMNLINSEATGFFDQCRSLSSLTLQDSLELLENNAEPFQIIIYWKTYLKKWQDKTGSSFGEMFFPNVNLDLFQGCLFSFILSIDLFISFRASGKGRNSFILESWQQKD